MKVLNKVLLAVLLAVVCICVIPQQAQAATIVDSGECGEDVRWTLNSDGVLRIIGIGPMEDFEGTYAIPWKSHTASVKEIVIGENVTTIGENAFYNCTNLKSVTLPENITSIGGWAFYKCESLETVTVNGDIERLGFGAFEWCESIKTVTFNGDVLEVDKYTFDDCNAIETITFGGDIETVGSEAFRDRLSLTNVTFGGDVGDIEYYAFRGCTSLLRVTFAGDVDTLDNAFYLCEDLRSITFNGNVGNVGGQSFYSCEYLESVTFKGNVDTISSYAFLRCDDLLNVVFEGDVDEISSNAFYNCRYLENITFGGTVGSIGELAFDGCPYIANVYLKNYKALWNTTIGDDPRENAIVHIIDSAGNEITKITVDAATEKIPDRAFYHCYSLTSVTLPTSITAIGNEAFYDCDGLTAVTIPQKVKSIGDYAFNDCGALTSINIKGSLDSIGSYAFKSCSYLESITFAGGVGTIGEKAFYACNALSSVTFNGAVGTIGVDAFMYCNGLETATFVGRVETVGERAFENCFSLTDVTFKGGVGTIGINAFHTCDELKNVTIEVSVDVIDKYAFSYCEKLYSIKLPADLTRIGYSAFNICSSLRYFIFMGTAGQWDTVSVEGFNDEIFDHLITLEDMAKITTQPKSVKVAEGAKATVTVKATGDGLKYYWYFKNPGATKFSYTSTFTGNTYSVSMSSARDGRQVYCYVVDKYGNSVKSDTVTLSMATAVKITTQPKSVVVSDGAKATVTVKATGDGLKYYWYFKNPGASKFSYTSSFTGNTYSVNLSKERSGRQVYCYVVDKYGNSVKSNTVTLTVGNFAKITTQPKSVTVAEGKTAKTTVYATGDGLTYKWYFKNKGASKFSLTTAYKTNSYSVPMDASRDGRQVYCVVTDKYGNSVTSNTVTLSMEHYAKITTPPKSVTVAAGAKATVKVTATGDGLKYYWYFKNPGATKFTYTSSFTGNTYSVALAKERSGRQVYCYVVDKYGNSVKSDTVTLSVGNVAKITKQPVSVTVTAGTKATVKVTATGDGLKYYWYFKNPGATKFTYTSSFTGNTYSVALAKERSGRQVYCYVVDKYGNSVKSNTVTLYTK